MRKEIALAIFVLCTVAIFAISTYFRAPMLKFYGFYEPDGYFHFSVIETTIARHALVPLQDAPLSGWPPSCNSPTCGPATPHHEPFGLYWITLIPYYLLAPFGVTAYYVARHIPMLFAIFDMLGAFFISRYMSKDKFFGLLVMLFIALNMGNAARTSALIYRGDSFITSFLLVALIFTVEMFRAKEKNKKLGFMLLSAIFLALCSLTWSGASFVTATYIFALVMLLLFGFTENNKKLIDDSGYMLGALLIWFVIVNFFIYLLWITPGEQTFTGFYFFIPFIALAAGWLLAKNEQVMAYLPSQQTFRDALGRLVIAIVIICVVVGIIYIIIPSLVQAIFVTSGFEAINNFSSTIQELQSPSPDFLYASFGLQNYISPMSLVMLLASYFNIYIIAFWVLLCILFLPYFFMQTSGDGEDSPATATARFGYSEVLLMLMAYFMLTAYLQMHAIRFNSLISVPLSIFTAFTVYWIITYYKTRSFKDSSPLAIVSLTVAMLLYFEIMAAQSGGGQWASLDWIYAAPVIVTVVGFLLYRMLTATKRDMLLGAMLALVMLIVTFYTMVHVLGSALIWVGTILAAILMACLLYWVVKNFEENQLAWYAGFAIIAIIIAVATSAMLLDVVGVALTLLPAVVFILLAYMLMRRFSGHSFPYYASCLLLVLLVVYMIQIDTNYVTGLAPADEINPYFITALAWMKNNTPANSVVLTLWPDGSLVEGVANRTSITDSVSSQYAYKANPFAAWLYNSSPDPNFLLRNITGEPDYLLVRAPWIVETGGIFTESGINLTPSSYGYNPFTSLNERGNVTTQVYQFFGSGVEEDTVITNTSGTKAIASYVVVNNNTISPFKYVDFYDESTGNSTIIPQTSFNKTNNQTFLIVYSQVPSPSLHVNITGAYMLNVDLADSNMVDFLFHCNTQSCPWDNNEATLQLVFINPDTKIFKIVYNESNATVASVSYPRRPLA